MGCSFAANLRFGDIDDRIQVSVLEMEFRDVLSYRIGSLMFEYQMLCVGRLLVAVSVPV